MNHTLRRKTKHAYDKLSYFFGFYDILKLQMIFDNEQA